MTAPSSRRWTWIGLAISFFAVPLVLFVFDLGREYLQAKDVLFRESAIFLCAVALIFIIWKKERVALRSVGLGHPRLGKTLFWLFVSCIGVVLADLLCFPINACLHLLGSGYRRFESFGFWGWVYWLMLFRVIVVEELFYRGYAMSRLQSLRAGPLISIGVPLLAYSGAYYREGWDGMIAATIIGAILAGSFALTRNLWITMATRFLTDGTILRELVVPIVVSCAVTLTGGNGTTVSSRSVILKTKHGPELVKQCMENNVRDATEFWMPSLVEVHELEERLPTFISERTSLGRSIIDDYKQYIGVTLHGRRLIFVNAIDSRGEFSGADIIAGWKHRPIVACGGGPTFWQVVYDPETKEFQDFQINGPL